MNTLDKIVVVDVESSCWKDSPPLGEKSEIIEIGIATIDLIHKTVSKEDNILIRPEVSTISPFCTELTGITSTMLEFGISFAGACKTLMKEYNTSDRVWASYGDYDRIAFEKECLRRHIPYPFGRRHINVKTLIAITSGWSREYGMDEALKRLDLPLTGTHHRAGDDAYNIANILSVCIF